MQIRLKNMLVAICSILLLTTLASSCSKDTSPADRDFFIGTYKGSIAYSSADNSENKSNADGKVTVTKVGSTYNFAFSDAIPDINGVKFEQKDDNTYISIGSGVTGITIDAHSLKILVTNSKGSWTADCTR